MKNNQEILFRIASLLDVQYAEAICLEMENSARVRGTGIARRSAIYIAQKMIEGKAIIAIAPDGTWAGFSYIETWSHGSFVANSGLIVNPAFRDMGVARGVKVRIFELSRKHYPFAKIFSLTTGLAVMRMNSDLDYEPVTYSELTQDEAFWLGCRSCVNYDILLAKEKQNCLCTAMLYQPGNHRHTKQSVTTFRAECKTGLMQEEQAITIETLTG